MAKKINYKKKAYTKESSDDEQNIIQEEKKIKKKNTQIILEDSEFCKKFPKIKQIPFLRTIFYLIYKEGLFYASILLITTSLYLYFALSHLGKFIYTDEPVLWLFKWIPEYWTAMKTGEWSILKDNLTYPAIPTLFFGGLISQNFVEIVDFSPETFDKYLFLIKSPVIIFNYFTLFIIYNLIKKNWDKNHAILATGLIALHPLIISFSQHTQGDTTLWNCFIITLLYFNSYLKNGGLKYIIFTSLFFALSVLSKFTGILLYPLLFIFLYFNYLTKSISRKDFIEKIKGLLLIYLLFLVFVFILYPTCWSDFEFLLQNTFLHVTIKSVNLFFIITASILTLEVLLKGYISERIKNYLNINKITFFTISTIFSLGILFVILNNNFGINIFSPEDAGHFGDVIVKNFQSSYYMAFLSFIQIQPWFILYVIFFAAVLYLIKKEEINLTLINLFLITILSYFTGSALNNFQMWAKYLVFIIPLLIITFTIIVIPLLKKYKKILISVLILLMIGETLSSYPTYFFYKNNLLPFNYKSNNQYDGNYGGYELSKILNEVSGSDTLKVLSDTFGFMFFFKGRNDYIKKAMTFDEIREYDYLYLTSFGKTEKTSWDLVPYGLIKYYNQDLDSAFAYIGNKNNYAKLVKIDKNFDKFLPENAFDTEFYFNMYSENSLAFWIKPFTKTENEIFIIGSSENDEIHLNIDSSGFYTEKEDKIRLDTDTLLINKWQHVVWINEVYNDSLSKRKLYFNGVLVSDTIIKPTGNYLKGIFINSQFTGKIDDIRLFKEALTQKQIDAIFNNGEITKEQVLSDGEKDFYPVRYFQQ